MEKDRLTISIHAAHAGCDFKALDLQCGQFISIHAAHAGCDRFRLQSSRNRNQFQSTQPMRAATLQILIFCGLHISIHAAHAGCDASTDILYVGFIRISIHAAHAGCDLWLLRISPVTIISIHAAHAGCDLLTNFVWHSSCNFNPRSPCGLRLTTVLNLPSSPAFQSTQPMRAATQAQYHSVHKNQFQSTQPMRAAT